MNKIEQDYKNKQLAWKTHIRMEPKKSKRFWMWVWYLIAFPFVWIFHNIKDWRTAVIFVIVFLIVSSEVWVPYLIAIITWGSDLSKWMLGIASACWLFWLGPGTPFLVICISLTIGIKALYNKIKNRKKSK